MATINAVGTVRQSTSTDQSATIAALQAQLAAMTAKLAVKQTISLKVSEKGALSAYGLGRFPVTLYREQWERLLAVKDGILQFIADNEANLTTKG